MSLSIADSLYRNGAMRGARARVIAATKFREFAGFLGESSSGFGIGPPFRVKLFPARRERGKARKSVLGRCREHRRCSKSIAHDN